MRQDEFAFTGVPGETFAAVDRALDERTIGHNPERLNLMKARARARACDICDEHLCSMDSGLKPPPLNACGAWRARARAGRRARPQSH